MKWNSEEEKVFKFKYVESCNNFKSGTLIDIAKSRLEDLERWHDNKELTDDIYLALKEELTNKIKWMKEVDEEINLAMDESKGEVEAEISLKEVVKDYSYNKVKDKVKDIRDN